MATATKARKTTVKKTTPANDTPPVEKNTVYKIVTDKIVALLEQGIVPWRKPWRSRGGSIARNAWNKPYRGVNVFILAIETAMKGYRSSYWLTYKQVSERGGRVKEGEHGTLVIFWKPLKVANKDKDGNVNPKNPTKTIPLLRYFTVFNLDQTHDVKMTKRQAAEYVEPVIDPNAPVVDPNEDAEIILASYFARDDAPKLTTGGEAWYRPSTDTVNIPELSQYDVADLGEYYSTAFHEIIHSTGATSRLDRKGEGGIDHGNVFGSEGYAKEELTAEMGSAFLCAQAGIDNTIENSAAYINGWMKRIKEDPTLIIHAAGKAQAAADYAFTFEDDSDDEDESADGDN